MDSQRSQHDAESTGAIGAPAQQGEAADASTVQALVAEREPREVPENAAVLESELREALRQVIDPEINLDIVTLGLVQELIVEVGHAEVRMILTTPFCPYAGTLVQQAKDATFNLLGGEVTITLLDEPQWTPDMMEGGDWSEWGLV
jgi:metal-sulfur cluster biosynthetic enzyme